MTGAGRLVVQRPEIKEISVEDAGQRIDNFLLKNLKGVPRSRVYRILRRGEVRVNRRRIAPDYRVKAGDQVRIPPIRKADTGRVPGPRRLTTLGPCILYEDDRLIVLNKLAGLAVHGGSGINHGVIEVLRAERPTAPFLELVHRLDRDTSGCLMIAKRRSELRLIHELLRQGRVEKRYLALVRGRWQGGSRTVDLALRKYQIQGGERRVHADPSGKQARSRFRGVSVFDNASLLEVELHSGRTHQIRVHAAALMHPVAGDAKYGDAAFDRELRKLGLKRLFLHANSIAFENPDSGRTIHVSAPLADDLRNVLDTLEKQ